MTEILLVQLINDQLGTLILDQANEPAGLDAFTITKKRDDEAEGFIFEFAISLEYVKQGREWIKNVYENFGTDAEIFVNIYAQNKAEYVFDIVEYQGQLQMDSYSIDEVKVTAKIEPLGFQRKFLNQPKKKVNLDNDLSRGNQAIGSAPNIQLPLAPKTIQKRAVLRGSNQWVEQNNIAGFPSIVRLGDSLNQSDFGNTFLETDSWTTPANPSEIPSDTKNFVQKVAEAGVYTIDFSKLVYDLFIEVDDIPLGVGTNLTQWDIILSYQLNETTIEEIVPLSLTPSDFDDAFMTSSQIDIHYDNLNDMLSNQNEQTFDNYYFLINPTPLPSSIWQYKARGNGDITDYDEITSGISFDKWRYYKRNIANGITKQLYLQVNDEIYVWFDSDIDFVGAGDSNKSIGYRIQADTRFEYFGDTVFPQTEAKAYLIYEVLEQVCKSLTDQQDCLRSEFFGRTDTSTVYPEDGEGSMLVVLNGRAIRQLDNQNLFINWDDLFQSLNSLYCIGWGFETDPTTGNQIIRVEPKSYFYRKDLEPVEITSIENLSMFTDIEVLYSNVLYGYPELENINQVNGVDEYNTQREISSPLTNVTSELDIRSVIRGSGFEIESQRRLIDSTEESRLDDKNFFIAVKRDLVNGGYVVEQGVDFESVQNVFDPNTAYNLRISPARNIRRWREWLASNVIRSSDKIFKFTFGDFNYQMISKLTSETEEVREDGDLSLVDIEPYFYPDVYDLSGEVSKTIDNLITERIYGTITGLDWNGEKIRGFINDFDRVPVERKGEFRLRRAFIPEDGDEQTPPPPANVPATLQLNYTLFYNYRATGANPKSFYFEISNEPVGTPMIRIESTLGLPVEVDTELIWNGSGYDVYIPWEFTGSGTKPLNVFYKDDRGENQLCRMVITGNSSLGAGQFLSRIGYRYVFNTSIQLISEQDPSLEYAEGAVVPALDLPVESTLKLLNSGAQIVNSDVQAGSSTDPANPSALPPLHDLVTLGFDPNLFAQLDYKTSFGKTVASRIQLDSSLIK